MDSSLSHIEVDLCHSPDMLQGPIVIFGGGSTPNSTELIRRFSVTAIRIGRHFGKEMRKTINVIFGGTRGDQFSPGDERERV